MISDLTRPEERGAVLGAAETRMAAMVVLAAPLVLLMARPAVPPGEMGEAPV